MEASLKAMMAELAPVIRDFVAESFAREVNPLKEENKALYARISELEAKKPEIDLTGVEKLIEDELAKLPPPEPAQEVDMQRVEELIGEAVAALPLAEAGEPGKDGESIDREEIHDMICAEVESVVAEIPLPKDGADGRGMKAFLIDNEGQLVVTMEDGEMVKLGPVCGKDGRDGIDGKDAAQDVLTEEDEMLISATLRKELGGNLIQLPDPIPFETKTRPPVHVTVENHMPKRGKEKTVVTEYDERGRIAAYERFET